MSSPSTSAGRWAAVLCHIMEWGLSHGQTGPIDQGDAEGPVRHLYVSVASDLHARVEKATLTAGVKIAPWLRHMVCQISIADFPANWQEARPEERCHDSRPYDTRFMLRLDEPSQTKLQRLIEHFGTSKAEIIRQLIAQAEPEDFPLRQKSSRRFNRALPNAQSISLSLASGSSTSSTRVIKIKRKSCSSIYGSVVSRHQGLNK